jgi:hypothetical protein
LRAALLNGGSVLSYLEWRVENLLVDLNSNAAATLEALKGSFEIFRRQHDPKESEQRYYFEIDDNWRETPVAANQGCRNQRGGATTQNDAQFVFREKRR